MFTLIDKFIAKIKLYPLVLWSLSGIFLLGVAFSYWRILPYSPQALLFEAFVILFVSFVVNAIFASVFQARTSAKSVAITALILVLIITPPEAKNLLSNLPLLIWAPVLAMGSKYILAIRHKHLFNPAAFAVALTGLTINQSASWWVSSVVILPAVIAAGILIARKMRRFDLVLIFLLVSFAAMLGFSLAARSDFLLVLEQAFVYTPLVFFAFIMLTEPHTMPQSKLARWIFAALVAFLMVPSVHLGSIYFTPELALLTGNILAFFTRPKLI